MYPHPEEPSEEARKPHNSQIRNGICAADDREISFVPIPEWLGRWALLCTAANDTSNIFAFLDGRLSHSRQDHRSRQFESQQIACRRNDVGRVTYYEDFWTSRHRHVGRHNDLSISVSRSLQPLCD